MSATDLRELKVVLVGDAKGAIDALTSTGKASDGLSQTFDKLANVGKIAWGVIAAGITTVAFESVHAADTFENAHARLVTATNDAMASSKKSFGQFSAQVEATDQSMLKFGHTSAETEDSLSRLILATHDMTKAQRDVGIASDLAAAKGMSLMDATLILTKAELGNYTQLTRQGIASKEQVKNFHSSADAIAFLANAYKGQGTAAAQTFSGQLKVLKTQLDEVFVKIGTQLVPVVEKYLVPVLIKVSDFIQHSVVPAFGNLSGVASAMATVFDTVGSFLSRHKEIVEALALAIGVTLVAALAAAAVEAAVAMAPFIEVGLVIAGVVEGFKYAYEHLTIFHQAVDKFVSFVINISEKVKTAVTDFFSGFTNPQIRIAADSWQSDIAMAGQKVRDALTAIKPSLQDFFEGFKNPDLKIAADSWGSEVAIAGQQVHIVLDNAVYYIKQSFGDVKTFSERIWNDIYMTMRGKVEAVYNYFKQIWPSIESLFYAAYDIVKVAVYAIAAVVDVVLRTIIAAWKLWGDDIYQYLKGVMEVIAGIIETVLAVITGHWSEAWEGIKRILAGLWDSITALVGAAFDLFRTVIWNHLGDIVGFFVKLPQRILDGIGDLGSKLFDLGAKALQKMTDGSVSALTALGQFIGNIPGFVTGILGVLAPRMFDIGVNAISSLGKGIAKGTSDLVSKLGSIPGGGTILGPLTSTLTTLSNLFSHADGGMLNLGSWNLVGEQGAELIGPDGRVYPATQTRSMLSSSAPTEIHLHYNGTVISERDAGRWFLDQLQKISKQNGGLTFAS